MTLRFVLTGGLLLLAAWICAFNAHVLIAQIKRQKSPSWVPLFGGIAGAVGLYLLPIPAAAHYWWLPLVLDWGSLPGLTHAAVWWLLRGRRQ